jgi:SAM-dependent methyltransferase
MTERTTGIYKLVTIPRIYRGLQDLLGGDGARKRVRDRWLPDIAGTAVLEVGCGPGTWVPTLAAAASYVGVDWNADHIAQAKLRFGADPTRQFQCGDVTDPAVINDTATYDYIFVFGVLHHIDDANAASLLVHLARRVTSGGWVIAVEPVYHPGQHPFAAWMKRRDSGQNIRDEAGYRALFGDDYAQVDTRLATDFLRVPYSHLLIEAAPAQ